MPRVKQFDQEVVLQRAIDLFWKQGYHATSVQDLVYYLGINRASLYDTFGGKKALFKQSLHAYRASNQRQLEDFLSQQPSVRHGLRKLFEQSMVESVKDSDRKGCFAVNSATELIPGDSEIGATLSENKCSFEALFYNYLVTGVERGEISPEKDLRSLSGALFTFYNGLKVVSKINPDQKELMSSINQFLLLLD